MIPNNNFFDNDNLNFCLMISPTPILRVIIWELLLCDRQVQTEHMWRQAIYFPDSPTKQISILLFQLSRSARSLCTASIGLSVTPSIWSFMLSHPHRPTHFRHPCYPCHPCHLPHNTHKRRTCHPVTPHYILLHTCYTISLQCYTTVTPSYTSVTPSYTPVGGCS